MAEPPQATHARTPLAPTPRDALWTSLGGCTAGLLSVPSSPNLSHGTRLSLGADGLLGYPRLAAGCSAASRTVQRVCSTRAYRGLSAPPHAPDARRFRRQALHLLLLGAEGDIDLQVRLEP